MEKQNRRPASRPVGGAERRPEVKKGQIGAVPPRKGQAPVQRPASANQQCPPVKKRPLADGRGGQAFANNNIRQESGWTYPDRRPGAGPQRPVQAGYSQMPLRPMTAMPNPKKPLNGGLDARREPAYNNRQRQQSAQSPSSPQPQKRANPAARPPEGKRPLQNGAKGTRPARPPQRPPQKRPSQQRDWIVPEGSPVYTAEGRVYEGNRNGARPAADPRQQQRRRPPQRRPEPPKKKKKKFNKEKFFHGVKTFFVRLLTMLLIVILTGFLWYRAEFFSDTSSRSGKVTFYMEDRGEYTVKAAEAYRGDVLYVDFSEIAGWFGMVSVGSVNSMRFICIDDLSQTSAGKGGEEYAIFTSGSTNVVVNGVSISLEDVCRTVDSHIWVPLSFVENYMSGVECDRGPSDSNIVFAPEGAGDGDEDEEKDKDEDVKISVSYKIKSQNPLSPVEYPA